jgi:hypothetical protein
MVLLNSEFLTFPEDVKAELIDTVKASMIEKFADTGVFITDDSMAATQFLLEGNTDLRVIAIHNLPNLETLTPESLGVAIRGADIGFVSVTGFQAPDISSLAEQVGTVASHEAGHLFLPPGHSVDNLNVMNDGENLNETLSRDNGGSLDFTDLQKALIRGDVQVSPEVSLEDVEGTWISQESNETERDSDQNETDEPDHGGNDDNTVEDDPGASDNNPQDMADQPDQPDFDVDLDDLDVSCSAECHRILIRPIDN